MALFISGGHLVSTNLRLHHYSDEDYKDIFYLKNNNSITKHCLRHSESEDINKKTSYHNGERKTIYKLAHHKIICDKLEKKEIVKKIIELYELQ